MGNNQHGNAEVRAGKLCYTCVARPPTHRDEFGGAACDECEKVLRDKRLAYVQADGYRCVELRKDKNGSR